MNSDLAARAEMASRYTPEEQAERERREAAARENLKDLQPKGTPVKPATLSIPGHKLLDKITEFIQRYVILSLSQVIAVALWIVHTYALDAADTTPYINVTSPEKRSGKTRTLEVLELLVNRPWLTGKVTPAVLSRKIDKESPTLLLDESDAAFNGDKEYSETLRGILNTGHRRGGKTSACIGQGAKMDYYDFSTYCPKCIAGIGKLPDTISDRSITIVLKRRAASEHVDRFRRKKVKPQAEILRDSISALVPTLNLAGAEPDLPLELDDRAADSWEPLLAIADAIGEDWPQKARAAAIDLSCGGTKDDQSLGIRLLADIKGIFTDKQTDRLPSAEIVSTLNAMEDAPWVDIDHKPLTANKMARLLKPYGVMPKNIRQGTTVPKGYIKTEFTDAWQRYSPALSGISTATTATLATKHEWKENATTTDNSQNVANKLHDQLSLKSSEVADEWPKREGAAVNDDCPPEEPPLTPEDDIPPDDLIEEIQIFGAGFTDAEKARIAGAAQ